MESCEGSLQNTWRGNKVINLESYSLVKDIEVGYDVLGGTVFSRQTNLTRLSWLWKFGGLYLDTDVLVMEDLLSVFQESFVSLQSLNPDRAFSSSVVQLSR